jgi:hypothetical protein
VKVPAGFEVPDYRQAVNLSRELPHVASQCEAYQSINITEQDVSQAFSSVETFCRIYSPWIAIGLLVEKIELRETGNRHGASDQRLDHLDR